MEKFNLVCTFRSSGDTLTRENFYKLKAKLAEARALTMQRRPSDQVTDEEGSGSKTDRSSKDSLAPPGSENQGDEDSKISRPLATANQNGIIKALRSRIQPIRAGELLSIMFMR